MKPGGTAARAGQGRVGEDAPTCVHKLEAAPARRVLSVRPAMETSSLRILVADDNRDAAESLGILFGMGDYDVRVVSDGGAAVAIAREWAPDVAVLDLNMPVMNGFAAAAAFRASAPDVILVALSGLLDEDRKAQANAAGFDLCVLKGTGFRDLRLQIEALAEAGAAGRAQAAAMSQRLTAGKATASRLEVALGSAPSGRRCVTG